MDSAAVDAPAPAAPKPTTTDPAPATPPTNGQVSDGQPGAAQPAVAPPGSAPGTDKPPASPEQATQSPGGHPKAAPPRKPQAAKEAAAAVAPEPVGPEARKLRVWPGRSYPLGATWDGRGVNFSLYAANATGVTLCLYDSADAPREAVRIELKERTDDAYHCYMPDVRPGQVYGYRVDGPYDPANGQRFNKHKMLLDPYAKAIARPVIWDDACWGYKIGDDAADLSFDESDGAAFAPLAAVIDPAFTWGDDRPPCTPLHKTVIYEAHVKGFTKLNPEIAEPLRGTYSGLGSDAAIRYLKRLGVTAVELLPVYAKLHDRHLVDNGLTNYWGYNTLGFFAPEPDYSAAASRIDTVREFKTMVRNLHVAGIEVILDVVYNHTCEGNQMGPTLTFRGIDNAAYYRVSPADRRYYMDFTGCGNTFDMTNPRVLQLIMDSLRYWVTEMHVDGFRFDLASTLARELHDVDKLSAFFDIIHQDPILSQTKLIAEPWDVGPGGYQVGNFPHLWSEWNGKYRDTVRRFWKGDGGVAPEFATRFLGSSDLYSWNGRQPVASVNFVTCHDGFSLNDLVSYDHKHNEANHEDNRDGADDNGSWNCGAEGPTDDPAINSLRERKKRNFIATLFLSQGVPMLLAGDEVSHSQMGNNNTYCQDSELSWIDWDLSDPRKAFLRFVKRVIELYKEEPVFHRRKFVAADAPPGQPKIVWIDPGTGKEMTQDAWNKGYVRSLGVVLHGGKIDVDDHGEPVSGNTVVVLFNADHETVVPFTLPTLGKAEHAWELVFDTFDPETPAQPWKPKKKAKYDLRPCTMAVFRSRVDRPDETV